MQMPTCFLYLSRMEIPQFTFATFSPLGTRMILLEIYLCAAPHKIQAKNFQLMPYFKDTGIWHIKIRCITLKKEAKEEIFTRHKGINNEMTNTQDQ